MRIVPIVPDGFDRGHPGVNYAVQPPGRVGNTSRTSDASVSERFTVRTYVVGQRENGLLERTRRLQTFFYLSRLCKNVRYNDSVSADRTYGDVVARRNVYRELDRGS